MLWDRMGLVDIAEGIQITNWSIEPVVGDTGLNLSCSCLQQTNTVQRVFCMSQASIPPKTVHASQPSLPRLPHLFLVPCSSTPEDFILRVSHGPITACTQPDSAARGYKSFSSRCVGESATKTVMSSSTLPHSDSMQSTSYTLWGCVLGTEDIIF